MSARSRRDFLRRSAGALGCAGIGSLLPQLGLIGSALAQSAPSGYKALVCVYLAGGNDSWNLLMPGDSSRHALYTSTRNGLYNASTGDGLAIPRPDGSGFVSGLTLPPAIAIEAGNYGVNPFASELATLYAESRLAFISNIGPLVEPLTRAEAGIRGVPPQLYSHNDQTALWQLGQGDDTHGLYGWGGRIAGAVALPSSSTAGLPPVLSIAGQTRFLIGRDGLGAPLTPFALSTSASTPAAVLADYAASGGNPGHFSSARRAALQELLNLEYPQPFSSEYAAIVRRALDLAENVINPAVAAIPANDPVNGGGGSGSGSGFNWPGGPFSDQLQQVARMIRISRSDAGFSSPIAANRQVYFVNLGGFDSHAGQITSATAATGQHGLLQTLAQGVLAFQRAMDAMGAGQEVTLFSMSEFARTLNSNGDGTDHAWGGVQFVLGGAVNGGQIIGRFPSIALDNTLGAATAVSPENGESYPRGQLIPTLAVDQLAATLARWMGVADSELPTLFPNIDRFASGPYANALATPSFAHFGRSLPNLLAGV